MNTIAIDHNATLSVLRGLCLSALILGVACLIVLQNT